VFCGVVMWGVVVSAPILAGQQTETSVLRAQEAAATVSADAIAVIDFFNITAAAEDEWVGAGIAETLAADLAGDGALSVVGREKVSGALENLSSGRDAGAEATEAIEVRVGRRLGARWIVSGAYQRLGDRLRITSRVVEVASAAVMHTAKVDGLMTELFALQDRLSADLRRGLPGGADATATAARAPTSSVPANDAVGNAPLVSVNATTGDTAGAFSPMTPPGYTGPPLPVLPEVMSRSEAGITIRAVRIDQSVRIDGVLDETVYNEIGSISGFTQIEPDNGAPASQRTQVWLLFDETAVYLSARLWESDLDRMVATEMRHDAAQSLGQNEIINFAFDTFYDRRNGYSFYINPLGGHGEGQVSNEGQFNGDWNGIWESATGRFDDGWTVEMAIPFKTLRYQRDDTQIWGFQIQRTNRWKNEVTFLAPSDPARGPAGFMMASLWATVVGIEVPPPAMNLDIKPYAISDLTTDRIASPPLSNAADATFGLDVKYGVTESVVADFTYNTDFAQVEADEQQVNLTRFSLFFPEKREFFLENQGTFAFGGAGAGPFGGGGETPVLFYSRRIGLSGTREVPIQAGGRLTGRVGAFTLGVLNIRSDDEPVVSGALATNFTVARLKRDVLRRSAVGLIVTNRSVAENGVGSSQTYGVDGTFAFFSNLSINTYWARTQTSGLAGDDVSYRGQLDYGGDRFGVQIEHLLVGDNFTPEVGFVRRDDMRKSYAQFRFSPRPAQPSIVRKYSWVGSGTYIEDTAGRVETREVRGEVAIEFQSSDRISARYTGSYEFLPRPFRIAPDVVIPIGGYSFGSLDVGMNFGQHRPVYGSVSVQHGTFFDGNRTTLSFRQGRVAVTPKLSLEPSFSINRVDLPVGSFTANLVGTRVTYTMTPLMFVSALVQYNSSGETVGANVRLRWEYLPGSELFVVYNEQRDTQVLSFPGLTNRALIIKVNRLFRF